ncbi:MAG: hypothetical protein OEY44_03055 [Candidatus Peregrinibacteria bacterium]|nr:hypothetical protein [Candidatus Peregrinibacteria bacterium]
MDFIKKEIFREFEWERLAHLGAAPSAPNAAETETEAPEATEAEATTAESPREQAATTEAEAATNIEHDAMNNLLQDRDVRVAIQKLGGLPQDAKPEDVAAFIQKSPALQRAIKNGAENDKEFGEKGRKAMAEAMVTEMKLPKNLKVANEGEVKAIMQMKVGEKSFADVYGQEAAHLISMRHDFRPNPDKKGEIQVNKGSADKPDWQMVNGKSIHTFLPDKIESDFLRKAKDQTPTVKDPTKFKEELVKEIKTNENLVNLRDTLLGEANLDKDGKMGIMELVASAMKLAAMFKQAMATGDFQTLGDALADFQAGRDVNKRIGEAKTAYENAVGKIDDAGTLLEMYADPYKGEAAKAFGTGDGKVPYRMLLKDAISAKMPELFGPGVEMVAIDAKPEGKGGKINITKNRKSYEVTLTSGPPTSASFSEIGPENTLIKGPMETGITAMNENSLTEQLNTFIAMPTAQPEQKAEENPKTKQGEGGSENAEKKAA